MVAIEVGIDGLIPLEATRLNALSISGWRHFDHAPKELTILCDGKAIGTVGDSQYTDNRLIVAFPPTTCESIELTIDGDYGSPAIREVALYKLTR